MEIIWSDLAVRGNGVPQADDGGEQVLSTDERLMIIDCENNDDK